MDTIRDQLKITTPPVTGSRPLPSEGAGAARADRPAADADGFPQLLEQELALRATAESLKIGSRPAAGLKLSAHAEQRLRSGKVAWGPNEAARVAAAIDKVASKGGKQALVLLGDLALIVSVPNRTVITAIPGERRQENVFTQIDSAAVITS